MSINSRLAFLVLAIVTTAALQAQVCEQLVTDGQTLYAVAQDGSFRNITVDPAGIDNPILSSDRSSIAYVNSFTMPDGNPSSRIVVIDATSAVMLYTVALPATLGISGVDRIGWGPPNSIWIEGVATPSTVIYYLLDIQTGSVLKEIWGAKFAHSANGTVAHVHFVPHGAPASFGDFLDIDDVPIYPPASETTHHHFGSNIAWSPAGTRAAVVDPDTTAGTALVLASSDGSSLTTVPLASVGTPRQIAWTSETVLVLKNAANQAWRIELPSGAATKLKFMPAVLSEAVATVGDTTYPVADVTCPRLSATHIFPSIATEAVNGDSTVVSALLVDDGGTPIAGQPVTFTFGYDSIVTAQTDAAGTATANIIVDAPRAKQLVTASFAGSADFGATVGYAPITISRRDTALQLTTGATFARGASTTVSAKLMDAHSGLPIRDKYIIFTLGDLTTFGATDAAGVATITVSIPADQNTGTPTLKAVFNTDDFANGSISKEQAFIYEPTTFVIWGGNPSGIRSGDAVTFWATQWSAQATGGDYHGGSTFDGWANTGSLMVCQPTANSTTLDASCWQAVSGGPVPPSRLPNYIGVLVATSINATASGTVFGNAAATVVIHIDPGQGQSLSSPATGTLVAVIQDGNNLFP